MSNASWALQQAIFARLTNDAGLLELLGGARIWDDVAERGTFPYVTFAPTAVRDWSTGTETGAEHALVLHVWSRGGGRKETLAIAAALRAALHEAVPPLAGHRLINLRHEATDVRRDTDGETYQGIVRFRAVTEEDSA